jgi:hypothetical protein
MLAWGKAALLVLPAALLYVEVLRWAGRRFGGTWAFSELLINYAGGYVRRGLLGEIIFRASSDAVPPVSLAMVVAVLLLLLPMAAVLMSLRERMPAIPVRSVVLLAMSPCLFLFVANDYLAFGRKDPLLIIPLWIHLELVLAAPRTPGAYVAGFSTLVLPSLLVIGHVHEAVIFTMPAHAVIAFQHLRRLGTVHAWPVLIAITGVASAGLMPPLVYAGSLDVARKICSSWRAHGYFFQCTEPPAAFGALAWSITETTRLSVRVLGDPGSVGKWAWLTFLSFGGLLVAADAAGISRRRSAAWLAVAAVCCLPLFALGWDWGRWISLAGFMYVMLVFHPANADAAGVTGRVSVKWIAVTAFFVLASVVTAVPHCCVDQHGILDGIAVRLFTRSAF